MAIQVNLDDQTFWAPRPLSRPRCVEGQSHSRPAVSQPKSSLLPSNANRGMIGVPKESLVSSPRLASSRDNFIYIPDDAASDMSDASNEPFDDTLPSVQAIVQSLEDAEKIGSTGKRHPVRGRSTTATANHVARQFVTVIKRHNKRASTRRPHDRLLPRRSSLKKPMRAPGRLLK